MQAESWVHSLQLSLELASALHEVALQIFKGTLNLLIGPGWPPRHTSTQRNCRALMPQQGLAFLSCLVQLLLAIAASPIGAPSNLELLSIGLPNSALSAGAFNSFFAHLADALGLGITTSHGALTGSVRDALLKCMNE